MAETKSKKPKFKHTRELVRIALDDGMTQEEIAKVCRVQQSMVSGWKNGSSRAYEHQIAELKKRYGSRLNRTTSRVYLAVSGPRSGLRWEDTELARRLLEVDEKLKNRNAVHSADVLRGVAVKRGRADSKSTPTARDVAEYEASQVQPHPAEVEWQELQEEILPGESRNRSIEVLTQIAREEFEAAQRPVQLVQVEGPVVLRYTFVRLEPVNRKILELTRVPVARWLVHRQSNGGFVLVQQERRRLFGRALWQWRQLLAEADRIAGERFNSSSRYFQRLADQEPYVECTDDAARWLSIIHGPMDAAAIMDHGDRYFRDPRTFHSPHDELTLPFLLRRMLIEHGHDVPGVARFVVSQ